MCQFGYDGGYDPTNTQWPKDKQAKRTEVDMEKRQRKLDRIRDIEHSLKQIAAQYVVLRLCCEESKHDCFLDLVEASGDMMLESLKQTGELLDIMWKAVKRVEASN